MKTILTFVSLLVTSSLLYSQSSIVFDVGTTIDVGTGADVSAGTITVNGTSSGGGTFNNGPLPVELVAFNAAIIKDKVELKWQTSTEVNNYGFEVERKVGSPQSAGGSDPKNFREVGSNQFEKIGFVNGHGNSNSPQIYSFVDKTLLNGKYSYRLKQIDNDGKYEYSKTIEIDLGTPKEFSLSQNYPNPFNPSTVISFQLAAGGHVVLKVYDALGNKVETLVNENQSAGTHEVVFQSAVGSQLLASGVYYYQLHAGSFVQTKKMIIMK
jgi:hypothetical protein